MSAGLEPSLLKLRLNMDIEERLGLNGLPPELICFAGSSFQINKDSSDKKVVTFMFLLEDM